MKLSKCPECGEIPTLEKAGREYKYFCGVHRSCGEWYSTKEKAAEDWNLRASFASEYDDERYWGKPDKKQYICLLEEAAETIENCYGRETELTEQIRNYLQTIDIGNRLPAPHEYTVEEIKSLAEKPYYHVGKSRKEWAIMPKSIVENSALYGYGRDWLAFDRPPESEADIG